MKKILLFTSILLLTLTTSSFAQHPTNLQEANITSSSVDLNCDASICGGAIHYRYKLSGSGTWINNLNINSNAHSLSALLPSTLYDWSVKCAGLTGWAATESFTTLPASTVPTIDNVFISDSIDCFDSTGVITIEIIQTSPVTTPLELIFGYVASFGGGNYIIKLTSASVNSISTIVVPGLIAKDYVIRLVDPVLYYSSNPNGSGSSLDGVYDEYLINLVEPAILTATTSSVSSNECNSVCIAIEDLSISGGTMPYSFSVNSLPTINLANGDSTYQFVALCEDSYSVVVTDTNGCSTLPSPTIFNINQPTAISTFGSLATLNPNGDHVTCNGDSNGVITASASGGTGAFTYSIDGSNFQTVNLFSGLSEGSETITYKDANGCTAIQNFTLTQPPALSGGQATTILPVDCYNAFTGEIGFQIDPSNPGDPGYIYSIDNFITTNQVDSVFYNLSGDSTYTVKIMDDNGCVDSSLVYLSEPAQIVYSTILSDYNNYEISCNDSSDGSIEFTLPTGGLAPYSYSINGGGAFNPASVYNSLSAAIYNIAVKDADGCIESSFDTLNKPERFTLTLVSDTIDCFSFCTGEIVITPLNGIGQILYDIDGGPQQNLAYFSGLCGNLTNGFYTLNAIDDNGCITDTTISIVEPTGFVYSTDSTLEYCDQLDGVASITVTGGGTGSLSYIWNNNALENSSVLDSVASGTYIVVVTDDNGCLLTDTVTVLSDEGFTVSCTQLSPCLGDSSGSATVVSNGLAPYEYQWFDAANDSIIGQTFNVLSNMPVGTYSVVVTDATDCIKTESIDIISSVNPIIIDSLLVSDFSCFNIDDAQIQIFASGGTNGFYNYSNSYGTVTVVNVNDSVFGPLAPNTYTLSAIDSNGCFVDTILTLSYPDSLGIDSTVFTNISCFGADDGSVQEIQFVGGTAPFEFAVDGGTPQTSMLFSGLDAGQHTIEVSDANNCISSNYITIIEPTLFEVTITASDWNNYQIRCNGDSSGYVDILGLGGTAPYLAENTIFFNTINIDNLLVGNNTFVVEDANGCLYQETILFEEPSPIQHNFNTTHVLCEAWNNGSVTDSVYGGVGSASTYSYLWGAGETTYNLDNLSAGEYEIIVTDENGCIDTASVLINSDSALSVSGNIIENVSCNGGNDGMLSVTASAGIGSYTYLWNDDIAQNNDTALGLSVSSSPLNSDTSYYCIVTDASGCEVVSSDLLLNQPSALKLSRSPEFPESISCYGASDGELTVIAEGGTPTYSYSWNTNPPQTNAQATSLSPGVYIVTVEDENGCTDTIGWSGKHQLPVPTSLEIDTIFEVDISCFGTVVSSSIKIFASGGTSFEATYAFTLFLDGVAEDSVVHVQGLDAPDTLEFNSLVPGNYQAIVYDANGCNVTSVFVEITQPSEPLTILVESVDETCLDGGIIKIFAEGGSEPFNYFINGIQTLNNSNIIAGNPPGSFDIMVRDTKGCEVDDITFIKDYRKIFLPDTLREFEICLGQSVDIEVEERPNLTYTWDDGLISGDRVINTEGMLPYGTIDGYTTVYVLTVTDLQGCEITDTVFVNFDAIDPMIDSDPGVIYGEYPVVSEGDNFDLFSNNVGNGIEYKWNWADNTIITYDNSITISEALPDIWYYLEIKDANGCLGYDSIYVVAGIKAIGESNVYEGFTPNNDGYNDTWGPKNIKSYEDALVQVYNRWGGLVFESIGGNDYQPWDGTNNGSELAVGTYYYIIDLNTGDEPQTGPVTIIR